jgi:hypothetical protein
MKKNRTIFYAIFALFHLFIFIFSLYMDSQKDNIQFLLSLQKKIWMLKYGSFIGLVLLVVDYIWLMRGEKVHEREHLEHQKEMTSLKAKLFDLQEAAKKGNAPGTRLPE